MSETMKSQAGTVGAVVQTVVLGMSVLLVCWTAQTVYIMHGDMKAMQARIEMNTGRLDHIEQTGSPAVGNMAVQLGELSRGQARIEKILDETQKALIAHITKEGR
jgi:hypothetical protein